jgi:hypothetical protein
MSRVQGFVKICGKQGRSEATAKTHACYANTGRIATILSFFLTNSNLFAAAEQTSRIAQRDFEPKSWQFGHAAV